MVLRLSALCTSHPLPSAIFLVLISVRGWVDPRARVKLEGLGQLTKSNDLTKNQTSEFPACSIMKSWKFYNKVTWHLEFVQACDKLTFLSKIEKWLNINDLDLILCQRSRKKIICNKIIQTGLKSGATIRLQAEPRRCNQYSDWLWHAWLRGQSLSPSRVKNFLFSTLSRPALGPTKSPIQWVPGVLSRGQSGRGVKMTIHLKLVPRSRKHESIHSLPPYAFMA
jgi:hypothetical protein